MGTGRIGIGIALALTLGLPLGGGCSCGDDDDPGTDRVEATIDEAGGTLTSADGRLTLDVPAGALTAPVTLFVEGSAGDAPDGVLGTPYQLGPEGTAFREPATLRIRWDDGVLGERSPHALRMATQAAGIVWNCIAQSAADTESGELVASITHLSRWAILFDTCDDQQPCTAPERCSADGHCVIPCATDDECGAPMRCVDQVCAFHVCRSHDDCGDPATQACSRTDGASGVCTFTCAPDGEPPIEAGAACGQPQAVEGQRQFECTQGGQCVMSDRCDDADAPSEVQDCSAFEADHDRACVHGWCVRTDLGSPEPLELLCDDGQDDDGDGDVDCDDADCAGDPTCTAGIEICGVAGDEDGDALADCADPDCAGDPACGDNAAVVEVAPANYLTCVRTVGGHVKCWGDNVAGSLGLGDTESRGDEPGEMGAALPTVDLGPGRTATGLCASAHACAVLDGGAVKCWGENSNGELGQGDTERRGDELGEMGAALLEVDLGGAARQVACGDGHTCALLDDGSVKCWGANFFGQLGLGDTERRGDVPGEMGAALPAVDLGTGRTATAVAAQHWFTCALLDDASVKCWGQNTNGELGQGLVTDRIGTAAGQMGDDLSPVDLGAGRGVVQVATGKDSACAIADDSTLACWGWNLGGVLGLGLADENIGDDPADLGNALPRVDLGTGRSPVAVAAGSLWMVALRDDGTVVQWGVQLVPVTIGDDPAEMGDALVPLDFGQGLAPTSIAASSTHACALFPAGRVKCWGHPLSGGLGQGDELPHGFGMERMGDELPFVEVGPE